MFRCFPTNSALLNAIKGTCIQTFLPSFLHSLCLQILTACQILCHLGREKTKTNRSQLSAVHPLVEGERQEHEVFKKKYVVTKSAEEEEEKRGWPYRESESCQLLIRGLSRKGDHHRQKQAAVTHGR